MSKPIAVDNFTDLQKIVYNTCIMDAIDRAKLCINLTAQERGEVIERLKEQLYPNH